MKNEFSSSVGKKLDSFPFRVSSIACIPIHYTTPFLLRSGVYRQVLWCMYHMKVPWA